MAFDPITLGIAGYMLFRGVTQHQTPAPATNNTTPPPPPAQHPTDQANVSSTQHAQPTPWDGHFPTANTQVSPWGQSTNGGRPNDCLEHILLNQGFSLKEIYAKTDGK